VRDIRIEVERDSKVKVFDISSKEEKLIEENSPLTVMMQNAVQNYIEDDYLTQGKIDDELESTMPRLSTSDTSQVISGTMKSLSENVVGHIVGAHKAIIEYEHLLRARLEASFQRALQGKISSTTTKTGFRFRVMPLIPEFKYDRDFNKAIDRLKDFASPTPIDDSSALMNVDLGLMRSLNESEAPAAAAAAEEFLMAKSFVTGEEEKFLPLSAMKSLLMSKEGDDINVEPNPGNPGDVYWGPKPGGGNGQGSDPSEEALDPDEVEIPNDIYAKYITEELELPNLEPKKGESLAEDTTKSGAKRHHVGSMVFGRMVGDLLGIGTAQLRIKYEEKIKELKKRKAKNEVLTPEEEEFLITPFNRRDHRIIQMLKAGIKVLKPSIIRVKDEEPIKEPDMNAVVFVVLDLSGSMTDDMIKTAQNAIFNLRMALINRYKKVEFRYITFDTEAHVFDDEAKFFSTRLGGGTFYGAGFKKAGELTELFPNEEWDRYSISFGDSGDFNPGTSVIEFEKMAEKMKHSAYVHIDDWGAGNDFELVQLIKAYEDQHKDTCRTAEVNSTNPQVSGREALIKVYGKPKE
jgi:uncharacterized sporulation protein YeaH/YhbH (DUF444 family)